MSHPFQTYIFLFVPKIYLSIDSVDFVTFDYSKHIGQGQIKAKEKLALVYCSRDDKFSDKSVG